MDDMLPASLQFLSLFQNIHHNERRNVLSLIRYHDTSYLLLVFSVPTPIDFSIVLVAVIPAEARLGAHLSAKPREARAGIQSSPGFRVKP
jgi:hypothetical protein